MIIITYEEAKMKCLLPVMWVIDYDGKEKLVVDEGELRINKKYQWNEEQMSLVVPSNKTYSYEK